MKRDKRITLTDSIIQDLNIVAAIKGTNAKAYIENLVVQHLIDNGYPKAESKRKKK